MQRKENEKLNEDKREDKTETVDLPAHKNVISKIKETAVYDQAATFFLRAHVVLSQTKSDKYEVSYLNSKPVTNYGSFK